LKQEILLEELRKFLQNPDLSPLQNLNNRDSGPYPDILPIILHKLKNKLTPILGYAQILQMQSNDKDVIEKIGKIEKNAEELTNLFDDLKDSLSIKDPPMDLCNINNLIISENKLFENVKDNGIKLSFKLDKSISDSNFNPRQISLLLHSSIQNAITAIGSMDTDSGVIEISTGHINKDIYLKIRDNGCGIDKSDIDNIWTPFFSGFRRRRGIGLLIVEKAVSDHKGTYSVKSELGNYTEFTFQFPTGQHSGKKAKTNLTKQPLNILLTGFRENEVRILKEISNKFDNLYLSQTGIDDLSSGNIQDGENNLIFINSEIVDSEKNRMSLLSLTSIFNDSNIIMFYSGNVPNFLLDTLINGNIRFIPDRTIILTIINILATFIKKEE